MAQETELAGLVVSGKYRLVRRLGDSVPALYEARHPRLATRVAVRLWAPTMPWDAFRRGAELATTLRHPGVVQVVDFNCEPGAPPFLVCEWIEGTTLAQLMAASGLLPVPRVAALVESAAWALAAAHQQGVVHQELSPQEIHVVQAPGSAREWTKLDGFGVAAALARAGAVPPSPYRAPEQASPDDDDGGGADPQSDQHALAAIAFEMLAGVRPFESAGDALHSPPPLLSELAPGVTPAVDAVIRQALAPDPEERFSGVLEFARGLRDAAEGASTQVVRRRKIEAAAAKARAKEKQEKVAEVPVSPFFNPVQARLAEGFRPGRLIGWRGKLVRMVPPLPVGVPARVGLAMALLMGAFGVAWLLVRHPAERLAATATASAPADRTPSIAPLARPPAAGAAAPIVAPVAARAPEQAQAQTPTAAVLSARIAPQVEPIVERVVVAADPPPTPVLAVKRARSSRAARTPAAAAPAAPKEAKPAPAAAPKEAKPAPAAAKAAGGDACTIALTSKPWANLWLDGRDTGHRTPVTDFHVPCGDHKLVLKRDDLDIYQMEVITVRAGTTFKKSYPLR